MRLLLVHLSDIHIRNEQSAILGRAARIAEACRSIDYDGLDLCVIAISGDIAFSGTEEQYLLASDFVGAIVD